MRKELLATGLTPEGYSTFKPIIDQHGRAMHGDDFMSVWRLLGKLHVINKWGEDLTPPTELTSAYPGITPLTLSQDLVDLVSNKTMAQLTYDLSSKALNDATAHGFLDQLTEVQELAIGSTESDGMQACTFGIDELEGNVGKTAGGFPWPYEAISKYFQPASAGDLIGIAGRPGVSKTSLLLDLALQWGQKSKGIFLVNEGSTQRVFQRACQVLVKKSQQELMALSQHEKQEIADEVSKRITMVSAHGKGITEIAKYIDDMTEKPAFVVLDMLGNTVPPNGDAYVVAAKLKNNAYRMRLLAIELQIPVIISLQLTCSDDTQHPALADLEGSKTGLQTQLDLCIAFTVCGDDGLYVTCLKEKSSLTGTLPQQDNRILNVNRNTGLFK